MKAWNRILWIALLCVMIGMLLVNLLLFQLQEDHIPNNEIVEINRAYAKLQKGVALKDIKLKGIHLDVIQQEQLGLTSYMEEANKRIVLLPADQQHTFYRFTYRVERVPAYAIWMLNGIFLAMFALLVYILIFVKRQIIIPFHNMENIAVALKNRDFTYELPQQKYRFFGKFIWAVDVMKEELRSHEARELALMKEKKTMISSLSHDIRTPLSNIRLYTDALGMNLYPDHRIQIRISENCDKIDQYVKEIINTSSEELFDLPVHVKELYLSDVMQVLWREKERLELALVKCTIESMDNVMILGDIARLREVIGNVVDNALKYGDGKWVHMSFYEEDHHMILKIENSGEKIDDRDVNALFNSFYRGHNVKERQGNGLGLYICKQLMKKMDGDIFMSQNDGSVSFHIVFGAV